MPPLITHVFSYSRLPLAVALFVPLVTVQGRLLASKASSLRLIVPMSQRKKKRSARRISRNTPRSTRIETLESRIVMSADPLLGPLLGHHAINDAPSLSHHDAGFGGGLGHAIVESAPVHDAGADFWINSDIVLDDDDLGEQIDQTLYDAHGLTNQDEVVSKYGFDGAGQTVVVIDSGIAYNHYALGGGLGSGYRVVGGWDFTENDADPYDDGPEGAHGTHVAGIIGAQGDGQHSGVATGVDLVGLRVFDDAGNGYFSWVEQALDWVHTNKDSFNSPITAVNLSLGTDWNSDSIPSWAMLENEFAALEADGIFISVSAGNSFTSYNVQGLSYPAASSHVIPVMSVDNDGSLSYFSQRATDAIAAPGRWITSTVPDYAANDGDSIDDDWLSMSGTSMAAPYMAGASVLVRQAMEFVGQTGIDQWDIYDHMMATADSFYDSATNATYKRLNLEAAIDALMPTDDYGSTVALAHSLGTLTDTFSVSGTIALLDDMDYFTFTADVAGTVSMSVDGDHGLEPNCTVIGASGSWSNGVLSFDVIAGESYSVSVETAEGHGLGYYDMDLSLEASYVAPVTVKTLVHQNGSVYTLDSENWLSINGNRLWSRTQDFSIASNTNLVWQGTTGILLRHSGKGWELLDTDATKHIVNNNARVFSLDTDNILSVNGSAAWSRTNDFHIAADNAMYWHSTTGYLLKLADGGSWQYLDTDVNQFSVRDDGVAFALTADGNVTVDGVQTWAGISDMQLDDNSQLILVDNAGGLSYQSGSFSLGSDLGLASTQSVVQDASGGDVATSSFATVSLSGEATVSFVESTQGGSHATATPLTERETTASPAAKSELLFATAYSQEVLLEEEVVDFFTEEADELASLEAIDSLFGEINSFV